MRKNLLALSIAAMVGGLSGVANSAVFINTATVDINNAPAVKAFVEATGLPPMPVSMAPVPTATGAMLSASDLAPTTDGIGHILVIPYFSVQGANKTILSVTNTDQLNGKAVKLRFRGAANSDDIFDISVFLSPGDIWAATVEQKDGIATLSTTDTSCTLPNKKDIETLGGKFKLQRVQAEDPKQTLEGYVEILNMADIPPVHPVTGATTELYTAIKHVANVAPCTQAVMDKQAVELVTASSAEVVKYKNTPVARGYSWPTGGLSANWILVNNSTMASSSGEAVAVRATAVQAGLINPVNAAGNIVWFPQTNLALPVGTLASSYTADPLLVSGKIQVANYDFPDLSTPYLIKGGVLVSPAVQADELAAALATTSVTNDVITNGFTTDWVFSMPTRRYAVALDYNATGAARLVFRSGVGNEYFNALNTRLNKDGSQACVTPADQRAYNREEDTRTTFVISPDAGLAFCGETSVLAFNNKGKDSTLGAVIARKDIDTTFADGWFTINTVAQGSPKGLPIVGFSATKASFLVDGKPINLGGTWKQRTSAPAK